MIGEIPRRRFLKEYISVYHEQRKSGVGEGLGATSYGKRAAFGNITRGL